MRGLSFQSRNVATSENIIAGIALLRLASEQLPLTQTQFGLKFGHLLLQLLFPLPSTLMLRLVVANLLPQIKFSAFSGQVSQAPPASPGGKSPGHPQNDPPELAAKGHPFPYNLNARLAVPCPEQFLERKNNGQ